MHRSVPILSLSYLCLLLQASPDALAQLPLSIEQLMVRQATWQSVLSVHQSISSVGHPSLLQTSDAQSSASLALRYGLSDRIELNLQLTQNQQRQRNLQFGEEQPALQKNSRNRLQLGVNWLVRDEDHWPAMLLELRSAAFMGEVDADAISFSMTTYKSLDPVVLSLTLGADVPANTGRTDHGRGSLSWRAQPRVNVALNPKVSLLVGFSFVYRDSHAQPQLGFDMPSQQRIALDLGFGYALSKSTTIFVNAQSAAEAGQSALSLQWLQSF